jgi:hypothetical protein
MVPPNAAGSVDPASTISATFSEAILGSSVTSATFTLTPQGGAAVAATVSGGGTTATLTPAGPLQYATAYTVHLTTGIADMAGNALVAYQSTFTTFAEPGTPGGQPTVTTVTPANGTANVPISTTVAVTFSAPVTAGTVTAASFTLTPDGGSPVAAVVTYDAGNLKAVLTPSAPLAAGTAYIVNLTSAIQNTSLQSLAPFQSGFTTAAGPDITPPHVTSIVPADAAVDVATGQTVQVTFNEAVTVSPLTEASFAVSDGAGILPGTVVYDSANRKATFTPTAPLAPGTVYTVTLGTGIADAAGNPLDAFTSTFTTTAAVDSTAPTVNSTSPADAATEVATDARITALFSEPVSPATVTGATFLVNDGDVAGSVTYNSITNTAIFTPTAGLATGTTYTANVTTGVMDLSGNALGADFSWQFTTVAAADLTAPTVVSTTPADGVSTVSAGLTQVTATFSEALSAGTVNSATFTLSGPSGALGGAAIYDGASRTATLPIAGGLEFSATYTATLMTGITDLAGNPLASNFTWSFTTAAATEVIAPGVTQTVAPDGSTQVGVDLSGLTATEIQAALGTLQNLLDGTLNTSGPLNIVMTGDPNNPLALEVPLIITRSDVNIVVAPSGTITLDGSGVLDPVTGQPISNIVEISGSNVSLDGINVVNGQVDLITQPGGATSGLVLRNLVLHDAVTDDCINLRDCTDCLIENVRAYRCFKKGLQLTGVTNITVRNVTIGYDEPVTTAIACDPETDDSCGFGSNSPRAFVEIFKSHGGWIDGLTINSSRAGSVGAGQDAPDGTSAFGNGILLNQSSGNFTIKNVSIHDSAMAAGRTPHGAISVWNHATASTISIENAQILNNPFLAFSFAKKTGVNTAINVTNATVSGNAGGLIEVMNGPVNCTFTGGAITDGDPAAACLVVP